MANSEKIFGLPGILLRGTFMVDFLARYSDVSSAFTRGDSVKSGSRFGHFTAVVLLVLAVMPVKVFSRPVEEVSSLAKKEKPLLLETLKELVSIESGSRDSGGLDKLANLIASRLKSLGGQVALVEPSDVYKMEDTPEKIGKMVQ